MKNKEIEQIADRWVRLILAQIKIRNDTNIDIKKRVKSRPLASNNI